MVSVEDADLVLFLSGSALAGDRSDEQVIDRLSFGDEQHLNCDRRFGYGWDGVFWTRATNEKSE